MLAAASDAAFSSMTASLRKVALLKPGACLKNADPSKWHYGPTFDPGKVEEIHASFVSLLENEGVVVIENQIQDLEKVFWDPSEELY